MNINKQNELTIEWNTIKKINYKMSLVFIFLMSQVHAYTLWKKLFDFKWFIKLLI